MNPGTIIAALAFATAGANLAVYYPKMMSNHATLRPRLEQTVMALALILAAAALFLHPGIFGYVLAVVAVVPAALFLLGTFNSGLPHQEPAVAVDALAPDFAGLDAQGQEFRLSELRGSPVLLKFYRGYWCPYCVAELRQLNQLGRDFAALGVRLVAVSSDRPDELKPFARKERWDITLLADPTLAVHRLYNVQQRNFTPRHGPFRDLAIPTTILIDRDGRVLWLEQAIDFRVRPQAAMVLAKAKALLDASPAEGQVLAKAKALLGASPAEGRADACDVCAA